MEIETRRNPVAGDLKPARAVVLGASGLMGTEVVSKLDSLGVDVVAVARRLPEDRITIQKKVTWQIGSIADDGLLESIIQTGDNIFHFADSSFPGSPEETPEGLAALKSLKKICCLATERNCRLIYPSSGGTVYGQALNTPITEDHPLEPISSYGLFKKISEDTILYFERVGKLRFVILRISNCYGTSFNVNRQQGIVGVAAKNILSGEPVRLMGEGKQIRDFIHARDVANLCAYIHFFAKESIVLNVGSGVGRTMFEVAETVAAQLKRHPRFDLLPARLYDVKINILSPAKAQAFFGWTARIPFEDGVREICDHMLKRKASFQFHTSCR